MAELWAALESTPIADFFRASRWGYAGLSALHILGLAVLFGSVFALSLRLLGLAKGLARERVIRLLSPLAASGLMLSLLTGLLLFSARAGEYVNNGAFLVKLVLIALVTSSALAAHWRHGLWLERAGEKASRFHALVSMVGWGLAILAGRLIAFVD
ncbi:MAG: hypothetical protein ACPGOV_11590 [Magnetovibrionaceae bacterium]